MKLRAEIEIPENSSWQAIEDAKLKADWRRVITVAGLVLQVLRELP